MKFIHLHNHSHFSLLDATSKIDKMVQLAKKYDMPAVGLTDHGNMFGAVQLWKACQKENIKPIIGCEVYVSLTDMKLREIMPGRKNYHHLILIAMNQKGYENLSKIVSASYTEGFYYKPRVDKKFIAQHSEGVFCMTACLGGEVAQSLLKGTDEPSALIDAQKIVQELHDMFGDNLRLELQDHGIPEQKLVNQRLFKLHGMTGVPLVLTNDCHFLEEKDFDAHKALKCIERGERFDKINHVYKPTHSFRSSDDISKLIKSYDEGDQSFLQNAVEEVQRVSEACSFSFTSKVYHLPKIASKKDISSIFRTKVIDGFNKISSKIDIDQLGKYQNRLLTEMSLISKMGFESYLLIVADFIEKAKELDIAVGPGRGSAAGSLVCWCLGITGVDPIKYGLLFERFLNPERVSMPDIDVDFSKRNRGKIIKYVEDKYGKENVAHIITFGTLKPRQVIKDLSKAFGLSLDEAGRLSSLIPDTPNKPFDLTRVIAEVEEVRDLMANDPIIKKIFDLGLQLEDTNRHAGLHAAGIVITPKETAAYVPLFKQSSKEEIAAGYSMKDLEDIGLVKMDFLGLKTLDVIADCIKAVKKDYGITVDIDGIDLEDHKVLEIFRTASTDGIFQFESPGMKGQLKDLAPDKFDHIIAMNALYRPGPNDSMLDNGNSMTEEYIYRKNHTYSIETDATIYPGVVLDILRPTFGILVYQEQIMEIIQRMANYSLAEADIIRKAIGKKDQALMDKELKKFEERCLQNNITDLQTHRIAELIRTFGRYGFNKSHSAAYAILAMQTAYLKAYYPVHFMCALIALEAEDKKHENVIEYITSANQMGIKVLPPDVNYSDTSFSVETYNNAKCIRFGLAGIKGFGEAAANKLITERDNGSFKNFKDLVRRTGLNKTALEALTEAGATASLGGNRATHHGNIEKLTHERSKLKIDPKQLSILDICQIEEIELVSELESRINEWDDKKIGEYEKERLGIWITNNPIDKYAKEANIKLGDLKKIELSDRARPMKLKIVGSIVSIVERLTKTNKKIKLVTLEDKSGKETIIKWVSQAFAFNHTSGTFNKGGSMTSQKPLKNCEDITIGSIIQADITVSKSNKNNGKNFINMLDYKILEL